MFSSSKPITITQKVITPSDRNSASCRGHRQTKCALPEIRLGRPISGPEAPLINIGLSRCMPRQSLFMSEETRSGNRSASVHVRSASVHVRKDELRKPERVCSCPKRRAPETGARLFMSEKTRSEVRSASVHVHKHIYFCDPNPARVLGHHLQPSLREGSDIRSEISLNQLPDSSSATQDPSKRWAALEELGG